MGHYHELVVKQLYKRVPFYNVRPEKVDRVREIRHNILTKNVEHLRCLFLADEVGEKNKSSLDWIRTDKDLQKYMLLHSNPCYELPFPNIFIENLDDRPLFDISKEGVGSIFHVDSLVISPCIDGGYVVFAFMGAMGDPYPFCCCYALTEEMRPRFSIEKPIGSCYEAAPLVDMFLTQLNKTLYEDSSFASVKEQPKIKLEKRGGKNKKRAVLQKPIIVVPKKLHNKTNSIGNMLVEWTYRWEVRGHWRNIKGIGKDPLGNYRMQGKTWVSPFVKGPDEMPIIKKDRIMLSGNELN